MRGDSITVARGLGSLPRWGRVGVGARRRPERRGAHAEPARPNPAFPRRGKEKDRLSRSCRCRA
ncbi:hypothetical protein C4F17_25495 [Variovorax sp. PMC12]|nr:hypothetical protein C4F17_25495 [Variovorax sp. PMC12]